MLGNMRPAEEHIAENIEERDEGGDEEATPVELRDIREQVDAAPVVKLVNGIMAQSGRRGSFGYPL